MPNIVTHVPHLRSIAIWRKFYLLSGRGNGLELIQKSRDDLGQVNIPGDHWLVLHLFKNWYKHDVPIPVGMFLWLLRERQVEDGNFARWSNSIIAETGPAFRYVELATLVGETCESDPFLQKAVSWLLSIRLPNGGMPTHAETGHYDSGTTGQTLQALALVDGCGMTREIDEMFEMLFETAIHFEVYAAWGPESVDGQFTPSAAKTSLIVTAALLRGKTSAVIGKALNWLLSRQYEDGRWAEYDGGEPRIDTTFNVFQALHLANEKGLLDVIAYSRVKDRLLNWLNTIKHSLVQTLEVAEKAFLMRLFTCVVGPQDEKTTSHLAWLRPDCIEGLSANADAYGHTAILGIAIMEWVIAFKNVQKVENFWQEGSSSPALQQVKWLWKLEPAMPTFLPRHVGLTDLLYTTIFSHHWLKIIDALAGLNLIEMFVGVSLGIFVVVGILDDTIIQMLSLQSPAWASWFLTMTIVGVNLIWLLAKLALSGTRIRRFTLYVFSLISIIIFLLYYNIVNPISGFIPFVRLVATYGLVIDIASHMSDRSGFVRYLLEAR